MNAETERLFAFAQKKLTAAEKVLTIDIYEVAGREAYLAALAAARAVIVNSGKKSPKTHDGARTVFAALRPKRAGRSTMCNRAAPRRGRCR